MSVKIEKTIKPFRFFTSNSFEKLTIFYYTIQEHKINQL